MSNAVTATPTEFSDLLKQLQEIQARRRLDRLNPMTAETALEALRVAAEALQTAIAAVCDTGGEVQLHTLQDRHHIHVVRTAGELFNTVVLRYSPDVGAKTCGYNCVLTDITRIEVRA